ncbi:MAG: hypothetical protein C0392_11330 [Syntrophus sp. (in: bacteria)]|nr:hypothetical protein [Syntrophus sp. (in: bacteria)]
MKKPALVKTIAILIFIFAIVIITEGAGQVFYRIKNHYWLFIQEDTPYIELFRKHPFLVSEAKPNAQYRSKGGILFRHNGIGTRGNDTGLLKKPGIKRVLTLGGSSTYCVGVSDNQTWPYLLEEKMGKGYEVINLGVPGYTTVEHVIQTALNISDLSPDICIFYTGWNDARNQHVARLRSDYADFHGKSQYNHLMLNTYKTANRSVIVWTVGNLLKKVFIRDPEGLFLLEGTADKFTDKIDERALAIYKRNLKLLIALSRAQGIRPVMVPQIMNYEMLTSDKPYGWIPYVKDKDLKKVIGAYNDAMREVCAAEKADFIDDVLKINYSKTYFSDNVGHFSTLGNDQFAGVIARYLKEHP